jgi:hypothetical protein
MVELNTLSRIHVVTYTRPPTPVAVVGFSDTRSCFPAIRFS